MKSKKRAAREAIMAKLHAALQRGDFAFLDANRRRSMKPAIDGPFIYPGEPGHEDAPFEEVLVVGPPFEVQPPRPMAWVNPDPRKKKVKKS